MKGRKPKLRVLEGGASPDRCPGPPSWLSKYAASEWRRAAPDLHRRGFLTRDTFATLESHCIAVGTVRECEELLQRDGRIIQGEKGPVQHPAFRMQAAAMREARLLAAELGLTPHRRIKPTGGEVGDPPPASAGDPWEGMLS